jgi:uncharacterized protein (DUF1015 family)
MATIRPFKGVRFNGKEISNLVCPPYDVISEEEKRSLLKMSWQNIVRIELPDPKGSKNKYEQAGSIFREWLSKDVLLEDAKPALYFYEQEFKSGGKKTYRTGFFAALKLENPGKGDIKPHEKTLAKPKQDRLNLLREVKANISPIFGLFNDKNKRVVGFSKKISRLAPTALAREKKTGVVNKLWKIDDEKTVKEVVAAVSKSSVFIADGHHRYETGWNYLQERKKHGKYDPRANYNYVLAFLCPMEDPGLVVWPTHRVVEPPKDIEEKIARSFKVFPAASFAKLSGKLPQPMLVYFNGRSRTLVVKDKGVLSRAMPGKPAAYSELAVSILHSLLLDGVAPENITYVKNDKEAITLAKKRCAMAVLVPSTPVESVKKIALAKQTMPQKSTYFYPKVVTGMVIHKVEE